MSSASGKPPREKKSLFVVLLIAIAKAEEAEPVRSVFVSYRH
ncbi:MAG: hypothetical protein V1861_06380 [Candidatus Micrarchaeota archaeon]